MIYRKIWPFCYTAIHYKTLRPGADQSSKAAFGKSAFAKTCSNVASSVKDRTGAHQSSKKQKYVLACATSKMLSAKTCQNVLESIFLVAQAVRRSHATAGVPSSRLGHSMGVSRWTKRGLGRFFAGFLPFSPTTNFIPPFLHRHLNHFVPFHQPLWWCVRRGRPAPLLLTDQ